MTAAMATDADFAVIGAGFAGLATAVALRASGASVIVFEARDRVGGRVLSAPALDGVPAGPPLVLDLGGQWVGPGQTEVLSWIKRLGLGTQELARRLAERVRGEIRFADPVLAVSQDGSGVTVESAGATVRCRRVAVCLPPPLAAKLAFTPALPPSRATLLAELTMAASVKFHAVYQRPFWRAAGLNGQAMSATGAVGLTYDNSPDDGSGRGVLVGLVVADQARRLGGLDLAGREREILAALGRLFGPLASAPDALVIQDWQQEEWTGGGYAAFFPPGGWTSYGSAFQAPCGRVHWAGTETSGEWNGYMEGALRSGKRAAAEMLAAAGTLTPGGTVTDGGRP